MGFMKRKAGKKEKGKREEVSTTSEESVLVLSPSLKQEPIEESCQQIIESTLQAQELKTEFQAVTSYIGDIQKIDIMEREDRELVNDLARKIITLSKDRERYKKGIRKIKDTQYQNIAKFEEGIPRDLKKMKAWEEYSSTIQNDLKYLESEKAALLHQKEEAGVNQKTLGTVGMTTCGLSVLLFLLFLWVSIRTGANLKLPTMLTITMDAVAAAYIFLHSKENKREIADAEKKLNRAIMLLNKVKIKYVNNTNALEYCYAKYMTTSYAQLVFLWEQYKKEKTDETRYKASKDQMEYYKKELSGHLKEAGVYDAKIWIHQLQALLDKEELEKVSAALYERRQKLKDRIDQNNLLKEKCLEEIERFTAEGEENKVYVAELLKKHGINL